MYLKIISGLLFISLSHLSIYAEDIKSMISVCSACHGNNGISSDISVPNLAGQKAAYMALEIKNIRSGLRKNSLMDEVVKNLSDKQIEALAMHYAKLPASTESASRVNQQGKNIRAICISCHGTRGITVNDQWPNLAGQKQKYLQKQLMEFRNGNRPGAHMQVIANELNVEQIKAVAEYYSQLSGR